MSASAANTFHSELFKPVLRNVDIAGTTETVMDGSERDFRLVGEALGDLSRIAVVGWSSQGPAQAQNLRDSLAAAGADTQVVVGLREGSSSRAAAEAVGFSEKDGTLATPEKAIKGAGMSLLLIADAGLVEDGERLMSHAPKGATVGVAHGFLMGYNERKGLVLRPDIEVVGVCPKGMGPSVRALYEQGSGINTSFAVEQGGSRALDRALGWALGLGAPSTFQTTLGKEWRSDVFGERAMLLGGVHGLSEAMYEYKRRHDVSKPQAYMEVVESLVGPISETISHEGLEGLYQRISENGDGEAFELAYNAAYEPLRALTRKIYADVSSGLELEEVVSDNAHNFPMTEVDASDMWQVGAQVRAQTDEATRKAVKIDPTVAGIYVAGMMAQADVLRANGHNWSEVVNESIIEAVDSLNPYMRAGGVAKMVDGCSTTARRGDRKWAPAYQARITQAVVPVIEGVRSGDGYNHFEDFLKHPIHQALTVLRGMRPPIDIAVA